jgi:hypothetical protein
MEPVNVPVLMIYVGGRNDSYEHYCREHGLPVRGPDAMHVTQARHLDGVHRQRIKIVHGDMSRISGPRLVEIGHRLLSVKSGAASVEEVTLA